MAADETPFEFTDGVLTQVTRQRDDLRVCLAEAIQYTELLEQMGVGRVPLHIKATWLDVLSKSQ